MCIKVWGPDEHYNIFQKRPLLRKYFSRVFHTHCKILRTMSQLYISFKRKTVLAQPELEIKGGMSRKKLLLYLHSNISIFPALVDVSWETCAQKKCLKNVAKKFWSLIYVNSHVKQSYNSRKSTKNLKSYCCLIKKKSK